MAEAFIVDEVATFTRAYYNEKAPNTLDPTPRYNIDENHSNLNLFRGDLGRGSAGTNKTLTHDEWHTIMIYLLLNLDECIPYHK